MKIAEKGIALCAICALIFVVGLTNRILTTATQGPERVKFCGHVFGPYTCVLTTPRLMHTYHMSCVVLVVLSACAMLLAWLNGQHR